MGILASLSQEEGQGSMFLDSGVSLTGLAVPRALADSSRMTLPGSYISARLKKQVKSFKNIRK